MRLGAIVLGSEVAGKYTTTRDVCTAADTSGVDEDDDEAWTIGFTVDAR